MCFRNIFVDENWGQQSIFNCGQNKRMQGFMFLYIYIPRKKEFIFNKLHSSQDLVVLKGSPLALYCVNECRIPYKFMFQLAI
jgi:hypothetical protein